jgi:EAL domain-containing protein (putative c-di-GMP-specific phosphodiesterase class I)
LGCSVALDDFGAGYTSFRNLKVLNVDMVKLDGSFCENLSTNRDNQYFVRSLIDLAKKFDLKTVAEWVQTKEDAILLSSWGIDYLQGDIFGEAVMEPPWKALATSIECIVPSIAGVSNATEAEEVLQEPAEPQPEGEPEALEVLPQPDLQSTEEPAATKDGEESFLDFSRLRMAISALDAQFRPAGTAEEAEPPGRREERRAG